MPDTGEIEVVDLAAEGNRSLPIQAAGSNFPMAIDGEAHRVLAAFRSPPTLMAFSSQDGSIITKTEICADADDVFVDPRPAASM